jgi:hypothetical protein
MKKIKLLSALLLSAILMLLSCSDDNKTNEESLDLSNIEISKNGINKMISDLESKTNLKFKGTLLNVEKKSISNLENLKSNIDLNNIILFEILAENGEILKIYSSPSSTIENEVSVFTFIDGYVTDEIKFNFSSDDNGNTIYTSEILSNETAKAAGWGSCMQGVFSSPDVGTIIQVGGVAGGLGCVPCAGVAGFFTAVGALGCLAAI